ncbi:MAG: FGGY family carbohydrate kinase [Pseudomonadota bacterium]
MSVRIGAIDQGTTSTRILVIEPSGERHVAHAVAHRQIYPQPGWVEHDPEELIENIIACVAAAGRLDALGFDNQGESCLAWDAETKAAISPVIVWQDERTAASIARLKREGCDKVTLERAGLPLDPYFSASKLSWILKTLPEARRAHAKGTLRLGTTDAFFMDRLADQYITDVSTASRTSLMNLKSGTWDAELCQLFEVPMECLPHIVPNIGAFGALGSSQGNIPITALIVDQQAALYGARCWAPGDVKMTFGTGAFALMTTGSTIVHDEARGLIPTVAWQLPGEDMVYAVDGGVLTAGAAINWAQNLGLYDSVSDLTGFPSEPAIARGLVFVPALSGLGAPHWDRKARGAFFGLALDHGPQEAMQAVLEGIALRAADVLGAMESVTPLNGVPSLDGGLTNNRYFLQFLADVMGRPLTRSKEPEVTALGAALLAGKAVGATPRLESDGETVSPQKSAKAYQARFQKAVALTKDWAEDEPSAHASLGTAGG